jgi:hypothetical protein
MSYDVATWADTSSNQASKNPGQLCRGYGNLGKMYYIFCELYADKCYVAERPALRVTLPS